MYFINFCHYRVNRKDCLRWIYVYYEYRLSFPTVYQSYCIVRIYCSTVREFFPIVFFFEKKPNNVLDTVLQLEFSVICGIRLFKLCPLLSLRMTCSCFRSMSCTYWTYPFDHCSSPPVHEEDKAHLTTFTTNSPLLFVGFYSLASFLI